jgi:methyl-CpG-binding domain protein 4
MVIGDAPNDEAVAAGQVHALREKRPRRRGQPRTITYVSRHFSQDGDGTTDAQSSKSKAKTRKGEKKPRVKAQSSAIPPATPAKTTATTQLQPQPRVYFGLNVDDLSSDSELTDVPDDIGPDPFLPSSELVAVKAKTNKKRSKHPKISPYFGASPQKPRPHFLSTLPFPSLSHSTFGLMQERLAHDPFRLLIATIFLNKTPGERAMPVFYTLLEKYPTPEALSNADVSDVTGIIQKLGFQNQRAKKIVALSQAWVATEPSRCKRYRKLDYPCKGDGKGIKADEVLGAESGEEANDRGKKRVAWEISHLPGIGAYAHDSWRMFCRDALLGRAKDWNGEGAEKGFEPEWKRVLPMDKELRAWMTWMWLKEGWVWNKETGEKERASEELMSVARGGGVVVEEGGKEVLTVQKMELGDVVEEERRGKVGVLPGEVLDEAAGNQDSLNG